MPPTLGQRLKHAREKRGLNLADIAHATKIPVPRLQDLEDNNLTSFGSLTYAKSFLRTYADLLQVNADEVLGQLHQPPLGGMRDYKYLVESHGPWVDDKREQPALTPAMPGVAPGRSFAFAALICLGFGLLIGGGVLANAFFAARNPAPATGPSPETSSTTTAGAADTAAFQARTPPVEQSSLSPDAFRAPDSAGKDKEEFTIFGVSITVVPNGTKNSKSGTTAVPKAQPVPEKFNVVPQRSVTPPKAQPVR